MTETAGLRKFALRLEVFLLVAGVIWLWGEWSRYAYWAGGCVAALALFLAFPRPLAPLRAGLKRLERWVGTALTYVVLSFIYWGVLLPLALAARMVGKKFLALKPDRAAPSYWEKREAAPDKAHWERQY